MTDPAAPPAAPRADPAWWDLTAVVEGAADVLRLDANDPDVARLQNLAPVACTAIDNYLDRCEPLPTPAPPPVLQAAVMTTIELYRRKDAPFGVLNSWSPDDYGPVRISVSWLNGVKALLLPYKCGWGLA